MANDTSDNSGCPYCGEPVGQRKGAVTCGSRECRKAHNRTLSRNHYRNLPDKISRVGPITNGIPEPKAKQRICDWKDCGNDISHLHYLRKYCSSDCKAEHEHYQRKLKIRTK